MFFAFVVRTSCRASSVLLGYNGDDDGDNDDQYNDDDGGSSGFW